MENYLIEKYINFAKGFEQGYLRALKDIENDKSKLNGVEIYKLGYKEGMSKIKKEENRAYN